ncbi:MAG: antitoxin Xre/MbcA/ParS toxin-binding domain-containing protein [Candidatus Limnocylindrales bacterium]
MTIQIRSAPVHQLDAPRAAVVATRLAEIMGIFDRPVGRRVDRALVGSVIEAAADAGLAEQVAARADAAAPGDATIHALLDALIASPLPASEIGRLAAIFGYPELERLTGTSEPSLRRYAGVARQTPDPVARRIHFLATLVAILRGSFNEFGIRRWLDRPHPALGGRAPVELLTAAAEPDDERGEAIMDAALELLA